MRYFIIVICGFLLLGCKKDSPKPPAAAKLSFPLQSSECTTGVDLNATTSEVEFKWQMAKSTETYELRVTNIGKNITQNTQTNTTSAKLPLDKGALYSWVVVSRNSKTDETPTSATWQFYNAGSQTTYPPFPAQHLSPLSGSTVVRDINNEVALEWSGADVDNDILGYEIYTGAQSPPVDLIASPSPSISSVKISVAPNTIYFWKVITRDREGNSSDSGIFSFKAL